MEQRWQSSCEALLPRTLNRNLLRWLRPEECLSPRSKVDSDNLLHEKHRQSDSRARSMGELRTCEEFHQILFRIKVNRVSAQSPDSPWSDPTVTWSKPLLLTSGVTVVLQFFDLILSRYHHVGYRHAKVIRPCRRILQPDTKELKTNLSVPLPCSKEIAVDQQLDPLIVDPSPLLFISM